MIQLNNLVLEIIDLPIPILRHPRWGQVKFPQETEENELILMLKTDIKNIEDLARDNKAEQIKIATKPSFTKLDEVGFTQTVYHLVCTSPVGLKETKIEIGEIKELGKIRNLIKEQFRFHGQFKPVYFTSKIKKGVNWFIELAEQNIKNGTGLALAAKEGNKYIGFIYFEIEGKNGCMDELYIEEEKRGKGLGITLIARAWEILKEKGIETMDTYTGVDQKSLGLYERLGFKRDYMNWVRNLD